MHSYLLAKYQLHFFMKPVYTKMRDPSEIVIIISDTFEDKLGIKKDSTKYLKETTNQPTYPTFFSDRYVQETNNINFLALVPESSSKNCCLQLSYFWH